MSRRPDISLNWREIDLILDEMKLEGAHIQKIRQPDYKHLVLDIYRPGDKQSLLISMIQGKTRLHFLSRKLPNQPKLQRFAQFLRSRCNGAKIISCTQPGGQRVIKMEISKAGEITLLWIRLWNNNSNIIATTEDMIVLDSFFRRPRQQEVSGAVFNLNISETKGDPQFLIREIPGEQSFQSKIESFYDNSEKDEKITILRTRAKSLIDKLYKAQQKRYEELEKAVKNAENAEEIKNTADLIMNQAHTIAKGTASFSTENWYDNNNQIEIALDIKLSARENADKYYKKYKKAKASLSRLEEEYENCIHLLDRYQDEVHWITETMEVSVLEDWLDANKKSVKSNNSSIKTIPGLQLQSGNYTLLVGRTAKENDALLRNYVRGNDTWIHTRDYPGGYVFIRTVRGKSIPLETLLDAGNLAIHYSKAKSGGEADLYYTQVKHLRRAKNGPLGLVLPTHEKNLHIELDSERIDRILKR